MVILSPCDRLHDDVPFSLDAPVGFSTPLMENDTQGIAIYRDDDQEQSPSSYAKRLGLVVVPPFEVFA